jgi:hypothetical protein
MIPGTELIPVLIAVPVAEKAADPPLGRRVPLRRKPR